MKNCIGIIVIAFFVVTVLSCRNSEEFACCQSDNQLDKRCWGWDSDSLQVLKGTIGIASNGDIVLDNYLYRNSWQRKTKLTPCSERLRSWVYGTYDSHLYLKSFDEDMWVFLEGEYVGDTTDAPLEFLFSFVSWIDEQEAITDSSHALRNKSK